MWTWLLACGTTDSPGLHPRDVAADAVGIGPRGRQGRRPLPDLSKCPVRPLAEWCNGESRDRAACPALSDLLAAPFYTTTCGDYAVLDSRGEWGVGFVHVFDRARTHVASGYASDMCTCGCVTWYGRAMPEVFDCLGSARP